MQRHALARPTVEAVDADVGRGAGEIAKVAELTVERPHGGAAPRQLAGDGQPIRLGGERPPARRLLGRGRPRQRRRRKHQRVLQQFGVDHRAYYTSREDSAADVNEGPELRRVRAPQALVRRQIQIVAGAVAAQIETDVGARAAGRAARLRDGVQRHRRRCLLAHGELVGELGIDQIEVGTGAGGAGRAGELNAGAALGGAVLNRVVAVEGPLLIGGGGVAALETDGAVVVQRRARAVGVLQLPGEAGGEEVLRGGLIASHHVDGGAVGGVAAQDVDAVRRVRVDEVGAVKRPQLRLMRRVAALDAEDAVAVVDHAEVAGLVRRDGEVGAVGRDDEVEIFGLLRGRGFVAVPGPERVDAALFDAATDETDGSAVGGLLPLQTAEGEEVPVGVGGQSDEQRGQRDGERQAFSHGFLQCAAAEQIARRAQAGGRTRGSAARAGPCDRPAGVTACLAAEDHG